MADTNSNTGSSYQSLPDYENRYSAMSAVLARLDLSNMDTDELSQVTEYCAETQAGLCHCLNFIGDALITFADNDVCESTPESLCQLGHGVVARSVRRCAAVDVGGFGVAFSRDITPMCQAIRASSPHELAHAVLCRERYFPAHDRIAVTSLSPQDRLMTSTHASGRRYSPML